MVELDLWLTVRVESRVIEAREALTLHTVEEPKSSLGVVDSAVAHDEHVRTEAAPEVLEEQLHAAREPAL